MKKTSLVLLLSACSSVYAELPTVIDNSSYPPSAVPTNAANSPSTTTLYELMGRLDQLQTEVQQLTGKVDEQAYRIDELKKHQSTMYSDFDERLQSIENKANGVVASPSETTGTTGNVGAKAAESSAPAPEAAPAPTPAPADKPVDNQAPQPKSDTAQVLSPEKQAYQLAYDELRNGRTNQSIEQFNTYLSQYPGGVYANNAQYWLGEACRA
jgi:TolA-binding protein